MASLKIDKRGSADLLLSYLKTYKEYPIFEYILEDILGYSDDKQVRLNWHKINLLERPENWYSQIVIEKHRFLVAGASWRATDNLAISWERPGGRQLIYPVNERVY